MLRDKRTLYYSVIVYRDAESDGYVAASALSHTSVCGYVRCGRALLG
jgi:hypothetical protein